MTSSESDSDAAESHTSTEESEDEEENSPPPKKVKTLTKGQRKQIVISPTGRQKKEKAKSTVRQKNTADLNALRSTEPKPAEHDMSKLNPGNVKKTKRVIQGRNTSPKVSENLTSRTTRSRSANAVKTSSGKEATKDDKSSQTKKKDPQPGSSKGASSIPSRRRKSSLPIIITVTNKNGVPEVMNKEVVPDNSTVIPHVDSEDKIEEDHNLSESARTIGISFGLSTKKPKASIVKKSTLKERHTASKPIEITRKVFETRTLNDLISEYNMRLLHDGYLQFKITDFERLPAHFWTTFGLHMYKGKTGFRVDPESRKPIKVSAQRVWRVSKHLFFTCNEREQDTLAAMPVLKNKTLGEVQAALHEIFEGDAESDKEIEDETQQQTQSKSKGKPKGRSKEQDLNDKTKDKKKDEKIKRDRYDVRSDNFWRKLYQLPLDPYRKGEGLLVPYINSFEFVETFNSKKRVSFNMNEFESALRREMRRNNMDFPLNDGGITDTVSYFGFTGSFFTCHVEDSSYNSCNIHVGGAIKVWYIVTGQFFPILIKKIKEEYNLVKVTDDDVLKMLNEDCTLNHKRILFSPKQLEVWGIPFTTVKQEEGDIMVLASKALHFGTNLGNNCAYAVNCISSDFHITNGHNYRECVHPYHLPHEGSGSKQLSQPTDYGRNILTPEMYGRFQVHSANEAQKGMVKSIANSVKDYTKWYLENFEEPEKGQTKPIPLNKQPAPPPPHPDFIPTPIEYNDIFGNEHEEYDNSNDNNVSEGGVDFMLNHDDPGSLQNQGNDDIHLETPNPPKSQARVSRSRRKKRRLVVTNPTLTDNENSSSTHLGSDTKKEFVYPLDYWLEHAIPKTPEDFLKPIHVDRQASEKMNDGRPLNKKWEFNDRYESRWQCPRCPLLFFERQSCIDHIEYGNEHRLYGKCMRPGCNIYKSSQIPFMKHIRDHWNQESAINIFYDETTQSYREVRPTDPTVQDLNKTMTARCEELHLKIMKAKPRNGKKPASATQEQSAKRASTGRKRKRSETVTTNQTGGGATTSTEQAPPGNDGIEPAPPINMPAPPTLSSKERNSLVSHDYDETSSMTNEIEDISGAETGENKIHDVRKKAPCIPELTDDNDIATRHEIRTAIPISFVSEKANSASMSNADILESESGIVIPENPPQDTTRSTTQPPQSTPIPANGEMECAINSSTNVGTHADTVSGTNKEIPISDSDNLCALETTRD